MFQDLNPLDRSTAILEIVILMLVAAIIGFIVAWLYYRSIYRRKLAALEKEYAEYRASHVPKQDLESAKESLTKVTEERNILRIDLAACQQKRNELQEALDKKQQELLTIVAERDKLAAELAGLKDQLQQVQNRLADCEGQLKAMTESRNALNAELERAEKEIANAQTLLSEAKSESGRLEAELEACRSKDGDTQVIAPVVSAEVIAPKEVAAPKKGKPSKEEKLAAIREKRSLINFDRIGIGTADQADDLKVIKGIGPFIEEKLNALGIYTFAQVSRFVDEDVETVTKAIAFFPGRIQRDNWVGQAAELSQSN